jgi:HEAT repeat protein
VLGADSSVTLPLIRAAALDTAWRSRAAAARALGAMDPRTSGAAGILVGIGLLTDPHPEVRFTAVTSLSELGLATSGVREALVRSSGDPDPRVREQARRALTPPRPER